MVKKIIFSILISMTISFVIFLGIMYIPETNKVVGLDFTKMQKEFFSKEFDPDKKKIFIIGSSHTQALNSTYIESKIKPHCVDCKVYNLTIQGDTIQEREKVIDEIISAKPEIIIYGISEADFTSTIKSEFDVHEPILPDIRNIIYKNIKPVQYLDILEIPKSPKDKTWNVIRQVNNDGSLYEWFSPFPNTPFLKIQKTHTIIVSEAELQIIASNIQPFGIIKEPEKNESLKILKQMMVSIKENDIKIAFFVTPYHDHLIDKEPTEYKKKL